MPFHSSSFDRERDGRYFAYLHNWQRSIAGLACCLVLAANAWAGPGTCLRVDEGGLDWPEGGIEVTGATAVGESLRVNLALAGPFFGSVELVDSQGVTVAESNVDADGNEPELAVTLNQALTMVPERGFQFSLRLSSADAPSPIADTPVRIRLRCEGDGPCVFGADLGVRAEGLVISPQLLEALREARHSGVDDVLGHVAERYPELAGHLPELELQLAGEGKSFENPCVCRWTQSYGLLQTAAQGGLNGSRPVHSVSNWHGPRGFAGGQVTDGAVDLRMNGSVSAEMELVCVKRAGESPTEVSVLDRPVLELNRPVWTSCDAPCRPQFTHSATSDICLEGQAFGFGTAQAIATGNLTGLYSVDGQLLFQHAKGLHLATFDPNGQTALKQAGEGRTTTVSGTYSSAGLRAFGDLSLEASRVANGRGSYAFGAGRHDYGLEILGKASCASGPDGRISLQNGNHGGGTVLTKWGDPPTP